VVITRRSVISIEDLPFSARSPSVDRNEIWDQGTLKDSLAALERQMIKNALGKTSSNQTRAADLLGISERMLRYKLKKYEFK
jgi:transcriptional regulator with PAS, ATPase and Fis domain